jgi:hypothetical protein
MYALLPFCGATTAIIFYFLIGGGLFSLAGSTPGYGFVGFAALVGMFTAQAVERLKTITEAIFAARPRNTDALSEAPLKVTAVTPASAPPGTEITVTGSGFAAGMVVLFGSAAGERVTVTSATELKVSVPAGDGPVDLTVRRGGSQVRLPAGFRISK